MTQLVESGFVTGQGAVNTVRILGGGTYDLGRRDLLSWSVQARNVTFDNDPGQTPYNDYAASLAWNHLIDPRTTLTTSVNFDWYDADDVFKSQRLFWQIMTGLTSQLTRRLTVNGSVGVSFANTWQNAVVVPLGTTTFQTGAANGWVGQVGLNYQLLQTTSLSASAAQLIIPTTTGQLQKTTTAGFGISHSINAWSNLAFAANLAHTDSSVNATSLVLGTTADFFSARVAYSYQLARDWRTTLAYTFRQRDDNTGTANSSTVLLSLNYNFNLLGNPSAFDPVDAARALVRQQKAAGEVFPTFQ